MHELLQLKGLQDICRGGTITLININPPTDSATQNTTGTKAAAALPKQIQNPENPPGSVPPLFLPKIHFFNEFKPRYADYNSSVLTDLPLPPSSLI